MRRQAEGERPRYFDQVRQRVIEIQRIRRVVQQADRNASESQNMARVATEELVPAQVQNVGTAPRVGTPPPQLHGNPRPPENASPSRHTNLRPATNPDGEGPGYDRMEE